MKPRVWENLLKTENWGDRFNLLTDKNNYEKQTKSSKATKGRVAKKKVVRNRD